MNKLILYLTRPRNLVALLLSLGVIIFVLFFIFPINKEQYVNQPTVKTFETESKNLIDKVSQLIYLPENETPTIATVTDLGALKGQAFFVDAKVGDKVLIYTKAKKAVLYNPKSNKIVTVAPLAIDDNKTPLQY